MKRTMFIATLIAMLLALGSGWSLAGYGQGAGDGTGPIHDVCQGTPFTYTGTVVTSATQASGDGLVISTSTGNVTIYGLGPMRYWEENNIDRPEVGESVRVTGYTVNFNGVLRNIATAITVGGRTLTLRSQTDCSPLWRRG